MKWIRFTIDTHVDAVDLLSYMLDEIGVEGIEIEDHLPLSEEDKKKIHEHIHFMYERLLLEGAMEDNWVTPVARWLDAYEPYTPFYA